MSGSLVPDAVRKQHYHVTQSPGEAFRTGRLLSLAASGAGRVNACGAAVRPGLTAGRAALKQEPGTADADQTGTAAHRAAAA